MVSKNELEEMKIEAKNKRLAAKTLKDVDGIGETIAFVWLFRQKGFKNVVIILQTAVIVALLGLYTPVFKTIFDKIMGLFK